ncbi:MAG: CBS domain-containing protein [Chitinivibrionales bacterium]|nr:CBS domain-containing protein [Chitinivibrionales bacterium]
MAHIKDIMTPNAETIQSSQTVKEAASRMKKRDVGILPVCEGNNFVGMITDRDITIRALAEDLNPAATTVGEIMTKNIASCYEDDSLEDAATTMEQYKVRRLLVKNSEGMFTGIISLGDLAVHGSINLGAEILKEVSQPAQPER